MAKHYLKTLKDKRNKSTKLANERFVEFKKNILEWKSEKEIFDLYENCHSPSQVFSIFQYENPDILKNIKPGLALALLKKIIPYSKDQFRKHLSMPQWWKIRFRHLDKTEEEVKQIAATQLKRWASNTHDIRRKRENYNYNQTIQHWIDSGFSEKVAEIKLLEFKRSCSPFTVEFWVKKGLTAEQAQEKASSIHKKGGIAACISLGEEGVSRLEKDIFDQIKLRLNRQIKSQHCINGKFVYDICDLNAKKIIEVNGTYWHADPRVYSEDNNLMFKSQTAAEIRKRDVMKNKYASKFGYEVMVVWEIDWHDNKEDLIQKILKFLG